MLEKLNEVITEKSEKIMTNEKVERFVNNIGGLLCFIGAVVFGIMFIVCSASLIKTGKNYVVRPSAAETETMEKAKSGSGEEEKAIAETEGEEAPKNADEE